MKKRILSIIMTLLFAVSLFALASCGGGGEGTTPTNPDDGKPAIEGVTFEGDEYVYDGTEKSIEVSGLPEGATVTYSPSNKATDAGCYQISATVKKDGHKDLVLTATLLISCKEVDVEWKDLGPFASVGETPEIEYTVSGTIGNDKVELEIDFGECDFTEEGSYTFIAKSKNPNYTLKNEDATVEFEVGGSEHKVTFDTADGKDPDVEEVEHNDTVDKPRRDPSRLGYEFVGWYYGNEPWDFDAPVTKNMTLTAKWKATEYTITYYLNGGVNSPKNPSVFTLETTEQLAVPTREGYVFLGWFEDKAFETPAAKIGTVRKNIVLYAKWSAESYTELVSDKTVDAENSSITLIETAVNGSFKYAFVANVKDFANDGAIYIGRGFDVVDGSYIKITSDQIISYTNGVSNGITSDPKSHTREMVGYIVVEVSVTHGKADVVLHTADGETLIENLAWSGRCGEIFVKAENVNLEDASFGWHTTAYDQPVWVLGDANIGTNADTDWTKQLSDNKYKAFMSIGANGLDSDKALLIFEKALTVGKPEYAIFAFATDSANTLENLQSFINICKKNSIVPILTTNPEAFDADNAELNATVKSSGERYIDFEAMALCDGAVSGNSYTLLGARLLYVQVLVDLPEITNGVTGLRADSADRLSGTQEDKLHLTGNTIKDGKYLIFNAKLDSLKGDATIVVGHGYMTYNGSWLEVGEDTFSVYNYYSYTDPKLKPVVDALAHGLEIKNFITVILTADQDNGGSTLTIATDGGYYRYQLRKGQGGDDGDIVAFSTGNLELTDANLSWTCVDYSKDIWIFGDSYLGTTNASRWPYYMYSSGYQNALMIGYAGMNTDAALVDLKDAVQYDTPEFVVWCMGMNDGDKNGVINSNYYDCTMEMLEICKQYGITPVVATIPTCLAVDNSVKNYYINEKVEGFEDYDYRIIDFARAVNGYVPKENATWYDNMLYSDNVHPDVIGAKALYMQFITDFPEIMCGWDATVYNKEAAELSAGSSITIEAPAKVENNKVYTFSADFSGKLIGAFEVGNDKNTEGATWIKVDANEITVYKNVGGVATLVKTVENKLIMNDLVNVRIHVKGESANVSLMSSGEKDYSTSSAIGNVVYNFDVEWSFAGDVFAAADNTNFMNASLNWYTAK